MSQVLGPLPEWVPELVTGSFRFSPAIAGAARNEWRLHRVTGDEVVVVNAETSEEVAVPRRFLSNVANGAVILTKSLECAAGRVRPLNREIIQMPAPSNAPRVRFARTAEVVAIRETEYIPSQWKRILRALIAVGCLACIVAVYVFRDARGSRIRRSSIRPAHPASHQPVLVPLVQQQKK